MLAATLLVPGLAMAAPAKGAPMPSGLLFNLDETDFCYNHRLTADVDAGAVLDQYIDIICDAGTQVLFINTNARKTNYASDAWESYFDGYQPDGPDDQPALQGLPEQGHEAYRHMIHSMWALDAQGVDYAARIAARCRQRGVSPWVSLRMNDVHNNDNLAHPFHGEFWRDPRYFRGGSMGYFQRALDYGHPEVRDLYYRLVVETLQRYDIDGLELDFMREPYCFREGAEQEGAKVLDEWLRSVRKLTEETAARRGHPVRLGVRVPSRIEVAQGWGLDAVKWAREGLVDLVVPTPRWSTTEFAMPMAAWKQALAGTGVELAGGLEILMRPMPGGPARSVTSAEALGGAAAVLADGADHVYLFNYFPTQAGWSRADYLQTLQAMSSLEAIQKLPRCHAITWRDITGPQEAYRAPLPATGTDLDFELPTGPAPLPGAKVTLELQLKGDATTAAPTAEINGTACPFQGAKPNGKSVLVTYTVPATALRAVQANSISVTAAASVTVEGVEVRIAP
ncbi:hypothetical protein LLH23_22035 [bacterium]|nr:hypothetical protein [bacterium]